VRAARPTILQIDDIVGRAALIRRLRATFSQGEKDSLAISSLLDTGSFEEGIKPPS
jgi:hypothetical protein